MQEELASVVFQRTPLAAETLRKAPDDVPRKLRTLLLAVDGHSSVEQYVPFLSTMVPLSPKLQELEALGMLQRRAGALPKAASVPASAGVTVRPETPAPAPGEALDAATLAAIESMFQPSAAPVARPGLSAGFGTEMARLERAMGMAGRPSASPAHSLAPDVPMDERPTLQIMLAEMERFVGSVQGLDGLPLALMFEQIRSAQQLRAELPDYAQLLAPHGAAAERHVARIASLLDRLDA